MKNPTKVTLKNKKPATKGECTKCGTIIAHPSGGKAVIHGEIVGELG
jgi:ribosomal protein S27E